MVPPAFGVGIFGFLTDIEELWPEESLFWTELETELLLWISSVWPCHDKAGKI